jgi:HSP20 family protein
MTSKINVRNDRNPQPEEVNERETIAPLVDVYENDQEILLIADLPGVKKEDLRIDLDKDRLTIEARRSNGAAEGVELGAEYRPSDFRRSFLVPRGIDREKVDAELRAGVLRLSLPRADALKPRTIQVRAG